MERTDRERFEDATYRLLAQHGAFVSAVQRIVTPETDIECSEDIKRRLERINAKRSVSPIEAFCASA